MWLCPTQKKMVTNIVSILLIRKGRVIAGDNDLLENKIRLCLFRVSCWLLSPYVLPSISFSWILPFCFSPIHTYCPSPDWCHYCIFWFFLVKFFFFFLLFFFLFFPLMVQTQITWVASKTSIRKGFSLLWLHIIIDISFSHNAAASLITSNTEKARKAFLWTESSGSHFNLWLYQ